MERAPNNPRYWSQRRGRRRKRQEDTTSDHELPLHPRSPKCHHFLSPSIFLQFVVSCDFDLMPNVTFHIQGQEFPLPPSAYTIQVSGFYFIFPGFVSNVSNLVIPCRLHPTAAAPASLQHTMTCGSWARSSSDITTPYSAEARAG